MDSLLTASIRGFACVMTLVSLSACNTGDTQSGAGAVLPPVAPDPSGNVAPHIAGNPVTEAVVGAAYDFTPNASDADGDALTFSIASRPTWALFNTHTGHLSGMPGGGDVGSHEDIAISVTDGENTVTLHSFEINVMRDGNTNGTGTVTLAWQPPTQNTDGTPLTNLQAYRIHEGTTSGYYTSTVTLDNAGLTRYVIENLAPGIHFFAITAVVADGKESGLSGEVSKTI